MTDHIPTEAMIEAAAEAVDGNFIPELWLFVAPDGSLDGFIRSSLSNGKLLATAEAAHKYTIPRKADRDRDIREGYTIRGGTFAEWSGRVAEQIGEKE